MHKLMKAGVALAATAALALSLAACSNSSSSCAKPRAEGSSQLAETAYFSAPHFSAPRSYTAPRTYTAPRSYTAPKYSAPKYQAPKVSPAKPAKPSSPRKYSAPSSGGSSTQVHNHYDSGTSPWFYFWLWGQGNRGGSASCK